MPEASARKSAGLKVSPVKAFVLLLVIFFVGTQFLILHTRKMNSFLDDHGPLPVEVGPGKSGDGKGLIGQKPSQQHIRTRHNYSDGTDQRFEGRSQGHHEHAHFGIPEALKSMPMTTLPGPSLDTSELVISALIERSAPPSEQLHLTTFFLSAAMVVPQENRHNKAERISPAFVDTWRQIVQKMNDIAYLENGRRSPRVPYFCRVFNSEDSSEYKVPGEFVPNRQTTDPNTNRRIDIFRCPLKLTSSEDKARLASEKSPHSLYVEILRKDAVIARFSVPWNRRRVGYLLSPPQTLSPSAHLALSPGAQAEEEALAARRSSGLRTWGGSAGSGEVHVCVVGLSAAQSSPGLLGQILQFVEYHLQRGIAVNHLYFSLHFSGQSAAMRQVLETLQPYIQQGSVTVTSSAGDHINMIDSFSGIKWNALSTDTFVTNTCLYLAKGAADYLGVWDLNEFFVPRPPHRSVLEVIRAVAAPASALSTSAPPSSSLVGSAVQWKGGRGMADGNGHPFCYLNVHSADAYISPTAQMHNRYFEFDMSTVFALDAASSRQSDVKNILPTSTLFQAGILSPGVCRLEPHWANCDLELLGLVNSTDTEASEDRDKYISCITNDPSASWINRQLDNKKFRRYHEYDDVVTPADGKSIQMESEGYLFRLNTFKQNALKADATPFQDSTFSSLLKRAEKSLAEKFPRHYSGGKVKGTRAGGEKQQYTSLLIPLDLTQKQQMLQEWPEYSSEIREKGGISAAAASDPTDVLPAETAEGARVHFSSGNGYMDFSEDFTRPDVLEHPSASAVGRDLPAFASDYTDIAVGSVIERKHDSWDLHLTTFLLNHNYFWQPIEGYGMRRIGKKNKDKWEKVAANFNKTIYSKENGKRVISDGKRGMVDENRFKCRIRNSARPKDQEYTVPAEFMPNKLTPDQNANNRLDILRCVIQEPRDCYHSLSKSVHSIEVTLLGPEGRALFHFFVPWSSRRTGYLLSAPEAATSFQPWKAFDPSSSQPPGAGSDELYMSVPGIESTVSQFTMPMYLEFLQHHYLIGVQHVFMAGSYAWNGAMMSNFLTATKSFIADGLLSVNSQSGDNFDLLYSFLGGSLDRDTVKIFHVNMYLYLTKGMVDYLGVWDIDEYFIPRLPHHTIMDVIRAQEAPEPLQPHLLSDGAHNDLALQQASHRPRPGWADGDGHPFCYLMLSSECIFSSLGYPEVFDSMKPWVGQKYPHASEPSRSGLAFKKSIIPTRRIFQAGLHMHGACHLGRQWSVAPDSPCSAANSSEDSFCNVNFHREQYGWSEHEGETIDFSVHHKFDSLVSDKDAKKIKKTEGFIYHYQFHRSYLIAGDAALAGKNASSSAPPTNEYTARFFPRVFRELRRRGLNMLVTLPESINEEKDPTPDETWEELWAATVKYLLDQNQQRAEAALAQLPAHEVKSPQYSTHSSALPIITKDFSDVILGSLIERQHDSFNLFLTTFFLCKEQLANSTKNIANPYVRPDALGTWMRTIQKARDNVKKYTVQGKRDDGHQYYCRMTNHAGAVQYRVKGHFIPNEGTPDANANKRFDVLRCAIDKPFNGYMSLARSSAVVQVELLRGDYSLVNFSVPWAARRTGFMLSAPPDTSRLNVWKGFDITTSAPDTAVAAGTHINSTMDKSTTLLLPGAKDGPDGGGDQIHMCIPGIESPMSKQNLAMYVENIEHHLTLGVQHIHLAATYTWGSSNMNLFLEAMGGYIEDGLVSVVSAAGDEDLVYGLLGMSMHRDNVKIFYVNMCLYLTKGMVDYLAIWDIDEYFIPRLPHHTIMDVIRAQEAPASQMTPLVEAESDAWQLTNTWKGGPGWADGDGHAFCYLQMHSEVLFRPKGSKLKADSVTPWVGMRFTREPEPKMGLAFKKPILPTRVIFQAGLHMAGGCRLEHPWSGCPPDYPKDQFCLSTKFGHRYGYTVVREPVYNVTDFSFEQRFDGLIMDKDTRAIDEESAAVLYHVQLHRHYFTSQSAESSTNEYVTRFYSRVVQGLRARGLELAVTLPGRIRSRGIEVDDALGWQDYDDFYEAVKANMGKFNTKEH